MQEACLNRVGSSSLLQTPAMVWDVTCNPEWINRISLLRVDGCVKRGRPQKTWTQKTWINRINRISLLRVDGCVKRGRPQKTWTQNVNDDMRLFGLKAEGMMMMMTILLYYFSLITLLEFRLPQNIFTFDLPGTVSL